VSRIRRAVFRNMAYPLAEVVSGRSFVKTRRWLETFQWADPASVRDYQERLLRDLLVHACATVPYYRRTFDALGLTPGDVNPETFYRLPVVSRSEFQRPAGMGADGGGVNEDMVSSLAATRTLKANRTSGTTAQPIWFYRDPSLEDWGNAAAALFGAWAGLEMGDPRISFMLHSDFAGFRKRLWDWLGAVRHAPTDLVLARDGRAIATLLDRTRPAAITGYPSLLRLVALALREVGWEERGRTVPTGSSDLWRPRAVIYHSETMDRETQDLAREVFGAPVHSRYGAMEFSSMVAQTCPAKVAAGAPADEDLHVDAACFLVEVVDDRGRPLPPGDEGRVVITDLRNRMMPFIRYDIGDTGALAAEPCACGRGWPLLRRLAGRGSEFLLLPSGRRIPSLPLMRKMRIQAALLWEYQFSQPERDLLTISVVPRAKSYGQAEALHLQDEFQAFLGEPMRVEVRVVDSIPREPSGKRPILKVLREG